MGQVTLAQLRAAARQRADMVYSGFVTDAELNDVINREAAQLHAEFSDMAEDYWMAPPVTFTLDGTASPPNSYPLPADFHKIRGLDYQLDSNSASWRDVRQFSFAQRNALTPDLRRLYGTAPERRYRIYRNALWIMPETDYTGTYRLWYTSVFQPLVNDTDAIQDWEGSHDLVILGAAIYALEKEESEAMPLKEEKEQLRQRITSTFTDRNAGEADVVQDRQGGGYYGGPFGEPFGGGY